MASLGKIRLLLLDCDGVLTDGRLYFSAAGEELKVFDVHDGLGIVSWVRSGNIVGIISGRSSPIVEKRAADLGIQFVRQGVEDKQVAATEIWAQTGISPAQTVYIGDDTPDVELIKQCGLGVAVASAPSEVKAVADLVTSRAGGRGAVREVIDQILADTLSIKQPEVHND